MNKVVIKVPSELIEILEKAPESVSENTRNRILLAASELIIREGAVGYAIGKLHSAAEQLEAIDKASRTLQIKPESYQELAYIAKQAGVDTEALVKSSAKLPKVLGEAVDAGSPMSQVCTTPSLCLM